MGEQAQYMKFWRTVAEKTIDVQREYAKLSDVNQRRVNNAVYCILRTYGIAGLFECVNHPPRI